MDGRIDGWMDEAMCSISIYLPILLNLPGGLQVGTSFAFISRNTSLRGLV